MEKTFEAIMRATKCGFEVRFEPTFYSDQFMIRVINPKRVAQAGGYIATEFMKNATPEVRDHVIASNIIEGVEIVS